MRLRSGTRGRGLLLTAPAQVGVAGLPQTFERPIAVGRRERGQIDAQPRPWLTATAAAERVTSFGAIAQNLAVEPGS